MKLVLAIVNKDDSNSVANGLTQGGFSATKLATTGGFLKMGNTTFLIGVDEHEVSKVMEIIRERSSRRTQAMPELNTYATQEYLPPNVEVTVGGATVFVLDVEQFHKL
ncbi:MAG: cyclic-di-AMP receptor [Clostridia bacterium]|nr:cyclic-di-AMP receptor [Clostridia bacterium]